MATTNDIIKVLEKSGIPMKAGEIADAGKIEKPEAEKLIKKLVAEGKVVSPKRCYYGLNK